MNRNQINLYWLIRLRWAAVAGQLLTVLGTQYVLGIDIPLVPLLVLIGLVALSNVGCVLWYRQATERVPSPLKGPAAEIVLGAMLVLDLLLLTAMLYCSGGPANPFSVFYIVGISLSAAVLRARWTWCLTALAVACFAFLFYSHIPVAALAHHGPMPATDEHAHHHHHGHDVDHATNAEEPMALHLRGMLVAFAGAAVFVAYFVARIRAELDLRTDQLAEAERRQAKADRLDSLVTMAAGAAHELATPLAAIAVAARELEIRSPADLTLPDAQDDIRTIRHEIDRCRTILGSLSAQAGENRGEAPSHVSLEDLIRDGLREIAGAERAKWRPEPTAERVALQVPRTALTQSLRSLIKNAIEASPVESEVVVSARRTPTGLEMTVVDHGAGIPDAIRRRIGEPFLTSKPAGAGLGLGIFVARRVVEQLGGTLEFRTPNGHGTVAAMTVPKSIVSTETS